jgi:transposase
MTTLLPPNVKVHLALGFIDMRKGIRRVTLGRKNHLFAGSDGGADRWATVCSLITTAKLNNVEPFAYFQNVLARMSSGHPMNRLDDLLPWNWRPTTALN